MGLAEPVRALTEQEYLALERGAEVRHEFFDGEMFAMAGGAANHSLIKVNVTSALAARIQGGRCVIFDSDLRIKVEATGLYTYPDVSIVCGPRKFLEGESDVLINPHVILEVLSDSTEGYDRGAKFEHYRRIPSLNEYLLVSQKKPLIELFQRETSGGWRLFEASGLDANIEIPSLKLNLPLREIFANIDFAAKPG